MALGLNAMLLGGECFVLERVELSPAFTTVVAGRGPLGSSPNSAMNNSVFQNSAYQVMANNSSSGRGRLFRPREWMPWSLLAVGALIVMYTGAYSPKPA
jgi:hypothetical protein